MNAKNIGKLCLFGLICLRIFVLLGVMFWGVAGNITQEILNVFFLSWIYMHEYMYHEYTRKLQP